MTGVELSEVACLIIGSRLGIGRETGISVGVGVLTGVSIGVGVAGVVGTGVVFGVRIILGVELRRERGPGLIGRTGSKYCVWLCSARVGILDSAAAGAGGGVSRGCAVGVALTDGNGVIKESGVPVGEAVGVSFVDGDGVIVGVGEAFFFFRCFGAGVGRTKSFLNLSPNVSSRSCVPRTTTVLIANVTAIANTKRSFLFTRQVLSGRQFLEHSLVHSNAGLEIFQRKIFIGRMRPAILQRQADQ